MTRNKVLVAVPIFLFLFTVACASSGKRKPTVFADQLNNIPADIPSQFLNRYEQFVTGKEQKEFKKLLMDEERQAFVEKFWLDRDPDPSTLENERKQEIDDRIDDISNERFFSTPGVFGLLFRSNGGFRGDMAHVYLLHGEPDAMDVIEGSSFVPMMLWVYLNPENGRIMYAFLFYQKGGLGSFSLFYQDSHQMDPCGTIYEVAATRMYNYPRGGVQNCPDDINQIYDDIYSSSGKAGTLDGNVFAWALFNFSADSSLNLGKALDTPKPASEIAKQSKARVTGEAPKPTGIAGTDYILASCEKCNSFIPAELQLGKEFMLLVRRGDIDWRVTSDQGEVELKVRMVLENTTTNTQAVIEKQVTHKNKKDLIVSNASEYISITLLTADEVSQILAGSYRASVYVKNVTSGLNTKKYNAWEKQFTK